MATLRSIALLAGVHVGTVAVVLNNAGGNTRVGAETREKVLRAARELGYVRNASASRLKTGRSDAVGFVGGDLRNPFFAELSALLEAELEACGLRLVVSHVSPSLGQTVEGTIELLRGEAVRRIVCWEEAGLPPARPMKPGDSLVPIGFTTRARPGVWLDLGHAIRLAVEALESRGLRRLGFYAPRGDRESPSVTLRRKMFVAECGHRGLPSPVTAAYAGESWNVEEAARGAREVLSRNPGVEAFLAFNDVAALGLLLADVSVRLRPVVVCFDGTALTRCWPGPAPLVLDLRTRELARRAVALAVGEDGGGLALSGTRKAWLRPALRA